MVDAHSQDKQALLCEVATAAACIALRMNKQKRSPHTVLPLDPCDFMNLLAQQKRMDKLRVRYGEPDEAYLNACFGREASR